MESSQCEVELEVQAEADFHGSQAHLDISSTLHKQLPTCTDKKEWLTVTKDWSFSVVQQKKNMDARTLSTKLIVHMGRPIQLLAGQPNFLK